MYLSPNIFIISIFYNIIVLEDGLSFDYANKLKDFGFMKVPKGYLYVSMGTEYLECLDFLNQENIEHFFVNPASMYEGHYYVARFAFPKWLNVFFEGTHYCGVILDKPKEVIVPKVVCHKSELTLLLEKHEGYRKEILDNIDAKINDKEFRKTLLCSFSIMQNLYVYCYTNSPTSEFKVLLKDFKATLKLVNYVFINYRDDFVVDRYNRLLAQYTVDKFKYYFASSIKYTRGKDNAYLLMHLLLKEYYPMSGMLIPGVMKKAASYLEEIKVLNDNKHEIELIEESIRFFKNEI